MPILCSITAGVAAFSSTGYADLVLALHTCCARLPVGVEISCHLSPRLLLPRCRQLTAITYHIELSACRSILRPFWIGSRMKRINSLRRDTSDAQACTAVVVLDAV